MKYLAPSLLAMAVAGCATVEPAPVAETTAATASLADVEAAYVADLVSRMSLERKVAQLIQPQINSFTAEDMERYRFGSYLNGGNGGPYGDEFAEGAEWLRLADEMWDASTKPLPGDEPVIPVMWGTDAVHGHTNVVRATIFPHNIALGATHDPDLVRLIGAATATEIEVTGIDWNFSPTVAVARDDRWGRTYESYSEDPQLVAKMGAALVEGLQGKLGDEDWLGRGRVVATAKHFFGDGGTAQGVDQGEVKGDIRALQAIHAVPYPAAIDAGVQSIMASFNSINGKKMHGNKELLNDYLRGELGFDGLVVGDWNGHGQVAGCTVTDCAQAINAGLDIYMVPDDWKGLMDTLMAQVADGTVSMERIDEAVTRVLKVKYRAGLLGPDALKPSARPNAGEWEKLGFGPHRAVAREAVAKSQVILKNQGVLPIKDGANILVAGAAADSIAQASGGWTLTWQGGGDLTNANFPGATSIWAGIEEAANEAGGSATLSVDGSYADKPDVAIVVFGEQPYAEFAGDMKDLVFRDESGLALLRKFKADNIPTVAVFLSGRPLWMNREINAADAFVASWLPGSEGAGVADVLTGKTPATGKLSFSWPASCDGRPLNGPEGALFRFGYGMDTSERSELGTLNEDCAALDEANSSDIFVSGRLAPGVFVAVFEPDKPELVVDLLSQFKGSARGLTVRGYDRNAQEDAREIDFAPGTALGIDTNVVAKTAFRVTYEVEDRPTSPVYLYTGFADGEGVVHDITQAMSVAAGKGWREMVITQACGAPESDGFAIRSNGEFTLRIGNIVREEAAEGTDCSF